MQIKIPSNLSFNEAATLGVGITTVGQALYQSLQLPQPTAPASTPIPLLIYGGSTATGSLAIQFAKLSGLKVLVTCSPKNYDYVKSLGADEVFDYRDPECSAKIKASTNDNLKHVFDCISEGDSTAISVKAMSSSGGAYSALLSVDPSKISSINDKVQSKATLGYTVVGEEFMFGPTKFEAQPKDFAFGKEFWQLARGLLEEGKVKVHAVSVNEGGEGLEGILKGLQSMREGKVSGKKLVYTL